MPTRPPRCWNRFRDQDASFSSKKPSTRSTASSLRWAVTVECPRPRRSTRRNAAPSSRSRSVEAGAGGGVLGGLQAEYLAAGGGAAAYDVEVAGGEVEVGGAPLPDGERGGRLAEHRRRDRVVDHHRQGEPAGEAHAERADPGSAELLVQARGPHSAATPPPARSRRSRAW